MLSLSHVRPCKSRKEEAAIAKLLPCAPRSAIPGSSTLDSLCGAKSLAPPLRLCSFLDAELAKLRRLDLLLAGVPHQPRLRVVLNALPASGRSAGEPSHR